MQNYTAAIEIPEHVLHEAHLYAQHYCLFVRGLRKNDRNFVVEYDKAAKKFIKDWIESITGRR